MENFDNIKKTLEDDIIMWEAQELCQELGMEYPNLLDYIEICKTICTKNGYDCTVHFVELEDNYQITQYGCYLIVENITFQDIEYHKKLKHYFYTKDFEGWGKDKKRVNNGEYALKEKYLNPAEIWNCKWGVNIGVETDGKGKFLRPVIIIQNLGSLSLVAALTTKGREGTERGARWYYKIKTLVDGKVSYIMLNQIKCIDKVRCIKRLDTVEKEEFEDIKKLLKDMYFSEVS